MGSGGLSATAGLLGAGVAFGIVLVFRGLRAVDGSDARWRALVWRSGRWAGRRHRRALVAAFAVGLTVAALTRSVVGAVFAALAVGMAPRLLRPDREAKVRLERIEAVAAWTEMLRDTLAAAAGLEQAIGVTATTAPAPIREQVQGLAARLRRNEPLAQSLREFADELDDPVVDLVVAALVMASEHHGRQLTTLLGSLATAARENASMRMRVGAARARTRTSVRVIIGTTLSLAAILMVLDRGYLAPYGTLTGQFVLTIVGMLFAIAFRWLAWMARFAEPPRLISAAPVRAHDQAVS